MKQFLTALLLGISLFVSAEIVDTFAFKTPQERSRAVELAKSLRCPQCQNQNLVESNSPIAYDLRLEVYQLVNEGKTNEQIIEVMTSRFGHFVNYKPPFQWNTALLWLAPFSLLLFGIWVGYSYYGVRDNTQSEKQTKKRPHFYLQNVLVFPRDKKKPIKIEYKLPFLLLTIMLFISLAYYFSLGRFNQVLEGKQENVRQTNQLVETPLARQKEALIEQIQQKLRQDPNNADFWLQLGEAYMQNDQFDNALIAYSNAEKIRGPQPQILGLAATALYYQAGQKITPKVQQLLSEALEQEPDEVSALSLLAAEAFNQKDYQTAQNYWQLILDSGRAGVDRRAVIQRMKMVEFLHNRNP
ncbi:heme lyase NrfEFG subunit NrfF [Rodentibacter caecimuris]|uniref:Formate-dependent nitrite reductase complex subunit n=1 Tax=Rodentibacter caecimuris TaxID=1796644 RepID=A0ABX3KW44_9PAST|nr:nitrite reductase [Rodentibacter heylii]